jgi:hypothetical protein
MQFPASCIAPMPAGSARFSVRPAAGGTPKIKSPAFYGGANDSFFIKEVTVCSVTKYRLCCCYWIWIFLFLLLFFFWRLNPVCIFSWLPIPVTLRLGKVLKARPMP